ncbi:zinc ribbon domain-containing protein [Mycobacteroides abscessus]|uniref:zinc ribbon domain-containing protein n=1 Tax=Mycobacteroides abscessus TaxID=36809 RepID=UPI001A98C97B
MLIPHASGPSRSPPISIRSPWRTSGPRSSPARLWPAKAADGAIAATKRALVEQAVKHDRQLVLIDPKHTTTDCSRCGARAKHRLPLSQRTYRCDHCGHLAPRDKNSAHVIRNRAGFNPAGADGIRPDRSTSEQAA